MITKTVTDAQWFARAVLARPNGVILSVSSDITIPVEVDPPWYFPTTHVIPQRCPVRLDGVYITHDPDRWMVRSVKIGANEQLTREELDAGGLIGTAMNARRLAGDIAQVGQWISVHINYIGSDPDGEFFKAFVHGDELKPS